MLSTGAIPQRVHGQVLISAAVGADRRRCSRAPPRRGPSGCARDGHRGFPRVQTRLPTTLPIVPIRTGSTAYTVAV